MIYIVGGAPRVGKSTLAKQFAKSIKGKLVSTDELENPGSESSVIFYNDARKNVLAPSVRIACVRKEAEHLFPSIEEMLTKTTSSQQDIVIEGVHLFPAFVADMLKTFGKANSNALFIGSTNEKIILQGMQENTSPNNWSKNFDEEVLKQIALFSQAFSYHMHDECKRYHLPYKERSIHFQDDMISLSHCLKLSY
ncbi:MAG: hypothetical protein WCP97_02410 [bacterium]